MAGCGCGGAGQWVGPESGLVPADQVVGWQNDPNYFWTGQPSEGSDAPPEVVAAPGWTPETGTEGP